MATTTQYNVTELTSDDFAEWAVLFRGYIDFYETSIDDAQYRRTFDRIINKVNGLEALVLRAEGGEGNKMVGLAHFFPTQTTFSDKPILFLNDLFVDPSSRGTGLGRKLIEAVGDVARKKGCIRVQWVTQPHNTRARALYDKVAKHTFLEYRMNV